jgi:cyclopropane-fatty-acyl-phospholipid synthase
MLKALLQATIREGRLAVTTAAGRRFECGPQRPAPDDPGIELRLRDRLTPLRIAFNPDLRLGEAYVSGELVLERGSIEELLDLIGRNLHNRPEPPWIVRALTRLANRSGARQSQGRARRNVAHHYDLSESLYRLFLDQDMQYSCAYFADENASIDQAQRAKVRHILSKLDLRAGQRVLDIGCGWGGLALAIARQFDVHVTGITLSQEQLAVARRRAALEGLDQRVSFELADYRAMAGAFERIVSVGMFEHVGPRHYGEFFKTVRRLLTDDGAALLHTIGARVDGGGVNAWMEKYIFPGGYVPTLSETTAAVEKAKLWPTDVEILRLHYAHTLDHWLRRFRQNRAAALDIYDEAFCRMWEFYLAGCAMSFRHGDLMVMQIQLSKSITALPITRDYMHATERSLSAEPIFERASPVVQAERRTG